MPSCARLNTAAIAIPWPPDESEKTPVIYIAASWQRMSINAAKDSKMQQLAALEMC
jgi:hypothetical protein